MNNINMSIVIILLKDLVTKYKGEYAKCVRGQSSPSSWLNSPSTPPTTFHSMVRRDLNPVVSSYTSGIMVNILYKYLLNQNMKYEIDIHLRRSTQLSLLKVTDEPPKPICRLALS